MVEISAETKAYLDKLEQSLRSLFELAKKNHELHFAIALGPEFRGEQGPGWCAWEESNRAFNEYLKFLDEGSTTPFKVRVALSFYCHLSEASGFYETPKNLLRIAGGEKYRMWPFLELNRKHAATGKVIAPNANKVFRDLVGHAKGIGLSDLAECFRDAFDPDVRNGYAHADYVIWDDGLRLRRQAGGNPKVILWDDFNQILVRGINFYSAVRDLITEYIQGYSTPQTVRASMSGEPEMEWTIKLDQETGALTISS